MTVKEALAQILSLTAKQVTDGIDTSAEVHELIVRARVEMSDEDCEELVRGLLGTAHQVAADLSADGYKVPGNDPNNPN